MVGWGNGKNFVFVRRLGANQCVSNLRRRRYLSQMHNGSEELECPIARLATRTVLKYSCLRVSPNSSVVLAHVLGSEDRQTFPSMSHPIFRRFVAPLSALLRNASPAKKKNRRTGQDHRIFHFVSVTFHALFLLSSPWGRLTRRSLAADCDSFPDRSPSSHLYPPNCPSSSFVVRSFLLRFRFFARFKKENKATTAVTTSGEADQSGKLSPRDLRQKKKAAYYTRKNNRRTGKPAAAEDDKRDPVSNDPKDATSPPPPPEAAPLVLNAVASNNDQPDAASTLSPTTSPTAATTEPNADGSRASPTPKFSEESEVVETYQPPRIAAAANEAEKRKLTLNESAVTGEGEGETEGTDTSDDRDPPPKAVDPCNICGCFN